MNLRRLKCQRLKKKKSCYLGNGQENFVEDNILEFGDFVWFKYCCYLTFKLKTFGTNYCEKDVQRTCENVHVDKENQEQVNNDI